MSEVCGFRRHCSCNSVCQAKPVETEEPVLNEEDYAVEQMRRLRMFLDRNGVIK